MRISSSIPSRFGRSLPLALSVGVLVATLTACGSQPMNSTSGAVYPAGPVYQQGSAPVSAVEYGRVTNVEIVRSQEQGRTGPAGAIIGGLAGAVIGHQIGGGTGRDLATIAGGVGGAVAGNAIQKNAGTPGRDVYRVSVQVDNGTYRAYDLGAAADFRTGDRVRIENGQLYRL